MSCSSNHSSSVAHMAVLSYVLAWLTIALNRPVCVAIQSAMYPPNEPPAAAIRVPSMKGYFFYALKKYPIIDGTRIAAAGGSFGGYMAYCVATHTGGFKASASDAGTDGTTSMRATEKVW